MELNTGYIKYISGSGSNQAIISILIRDVKENSITFEATTSGTSWSSQTAYVYQIIGRNM